MCARSLPQAQVCDLKTSGETEKPQRAPGLRPVSPVFLFRALQAPERGAFSPKLCGAAPGGARLAPRPSHSPEGRVASAAGGVTTEHFPRHAGVLLMQEGGGPVPATPPAAPPAAARAPLQLRLGDRRPPAAAPLRGVLDVGEVRGVQDPHSRRGAGGPAVAPRLENEGLALLLPPPPPLRRMQVPLLRERDGDGGALEKLGPSVGAPVEAAGGREVAQADGELLHGVVGDLLAPRQIQVLQGETRSERRPAERGGATAVSSAHTQDKYS